mgnify:CR=1 FL=1
MSNKVWKIAAQFDTYEEADILRRDLIETKKHNLVKVKYGLNIYRVKVWDPPAPKKEKNPKKKRKK